MSICPTLDWQWVAPHTDSPHWTKLVNTHIFWVWKIPHRAYLYLFNNSLSRACKTFLNRQFGNLCRVHPTNVNIPNSTLWVEICTPQPRLWGATHNVPLVGMSAMFWLFNILKRLWRNFIKFCIHIDIHKMNICIRIKRARGQFC